LNGREKGRKDGKEREKRNKQRRAEGSEELRKK
jgi:hypothetical protein